MTGTGLAFTGFGFAFAVGSAACSAGSDGPSDIGMAQDSLFPETQPPAPETLPPARARKARVEAARQDPALHALADLLPPRLRMGTSSWTYPGWTSTVWAREYPDTVLSRHGLSAYAQHPLLRTVSLDRAFYRPLSAAQYAAYAAQVPADFRFVVKAPSLVADAMIRSENGRGMQANPAFMSVTAAAEQFVQPALDGLGHRLGALVFQLSPLPSPMLEQVDPVIEHLGLMLKSLPSLRERAPDAVLAVEVRNAELLTRTLVQVLQSAGATYCLGLHPKMPPISGQLPILRALWPGPLVCRWNLHLRHGAYGYEDAKRQYEPFDRLVDPDPETRSILARVILGTTAAGWPAYVTFGNKAEGSAPLSVRAMAEQLAAKRQESATGDPKNA